MRQNSLNRRSFNRHASFAGACAAFLLLAASLTDMSVKADEPLVPMGQQTPAVVIGSPAQPLVTPPLVNTPAAPQPVPAAAPVQVSNQPAAAADAPVTAAASAQPVGSVPNVVFGGEALPVEPMPVRKPALHVKSLFFNAQEMESIRKAVEAYVALSSGENSGAMDFLNRLRGGEAPKPGQRYFVYPQFYLESLVYHSAEDWVVRINHTRLTNKQPDTIAGLKILTINKDEVTLEWTPADMQKVADVLRATPNNNVQVNGQRGTVGFTLHTNQTFSSYVMRVLEGKVMPMMLDLAPKPAPGDPANKDAVNKDATNKDDKGLKAPGKPSNQDFLDDILKAKRK